MHRKDTSDAQVRSQTQSTYGGGRLQTIRRVVEELQEWGEVVQHQHYPALSVATGAFLAECYLFPTYSVGFDLMCIAATSSALASEGPMAWSSLFIVLISFEFGIVFVKLFDEIGGLYNLFRVGLATARVFAGNILRTKFIPFGFCACWYVKTLMIDLEMTITCSRRYFELHGGELYQLLCLEAMNSDERGGSC
jgi:hypothetical protein